jgi:hypothetical protein
MLRLGVGWTLIFYIVDLANVRTIVTRRNLHHIPWYSYILHIYLDSSRVWLSLDLFRVVGTNRITGQSAPLVAFHAEFN